MNLEQALEFRKLTEHLQGGVGEDVWVVTDNGSEYGVLWFEGAYSDRFEQTSWSVDDWLASHKSQLTEKFDADGAWSQRELIVIDTPQPDRLVLYLDCGHKVVRYDFDLWGQKRQPKSLGERVECYDCKNAAPFTFDMLPDDWRPRTVEGIS